MTRLAVLADIHGNLPALQAVIDDVAQFDADHVVVAGDSVNWGPFSREVMAVIRASRWAVIRGNNEYYAIDYDNPRMPSHWSSFTMPPLLREQLGAGWLGTIACLPDTLSLRFPDAASLRVVHGIPDDPWQAIFPQSTPKQVSAWLDKVAEGTIICAHSHIPLERHVGAWHIFNPGSVGVPLDGDFSASYMVLEGDHQGWELIAHRRVPFADDALFDAFEAQRFAQRGGVTAMLAVEEFRSARLQLLPYLVWKEAFHPDEPDRIKLMEEFLRLSDAREYMPPAYRDLTSALHRD